MPLAHDERMRFYRCGLEAERLVPALTVRTLGGERELVGDFIVAHEPDNPVAHDEGPWTVRRRTEEVTLAAYSDVADAFEHVLGLATAELLRSRIKR